MPTSPRPLPWLQNAGTTLIIANNAPTTTNQCGFVLVTLEPWHVVGVDWLTEMPVDPIAHLRDGLSRPARISSASPGTIRVARCRSPSATDTSTL